MLVWLGTPICFAIHVIVTWPNFYCLTHINRMEFPTVTCINWNSPFLFKGMLGGIFHFYSNLNRTFCKQTVEILIRRCVLRSAASDLGLHCKHMSYKKDARLIWVMNIFVGSI